MSDIIVSPELQVLRTVLVTIVILLAFWLCSITAKKYQAHRVNGENFNSNMPMFDVLIIMLTISGMSLFAYAFGFHHFPRTYLVFVNISMSGDPSYINAIKKEIAKTEKDTVNVVVMPPTVRYSPSQAKKNFAKMGLKCEIVSYMGGKKNTSLKTAIHDWAKQNEKILNNTSVIYVAKDTDSVEKFSVAELTEEEEEEKEGEKKDGPQEGEHS